MEQLNLPAQFHDFQIYVSNSVNFSISMFHDILSSSIIPKVGVGFGKANNEFVLKLF